MVSDCGGLFVWVVEWRILVIAASRDCGIAEWDFLRLGGILIEIYCLFLHKKLTTRKQI